MADTDTQLETNNKPSAIIDMRPDLLVRVALLGLGLGVVAWILAMVLGNFVIKPVLCPTTGDASMCGSTDVIAGNIGLVLVSVAGMLGLVRLGVYRPLLIAIAGVLTLWGLGGWLSGIVWYEALGWAALIYMITYVAYAWLVRPRNFIVVIAVLAILVILVRWISTL